MGCTSSKEQDGASPRTPGKDKAPPPPSPPSNFTTPDEKTPACNEYRVDVTASGFGICVWKTASGTLGSVPIQRSASKRSLGEGWIDPTAEGHPEACDDFRVDIEHETFGMCKCGFPRSQHSSQGCSGSDPDHAQSSSY